MNALIWAVIASALLIFNPVWSLLFNLLFWVAGIVLYGGYPWIPGSSGWLKGLALSVLVIIGIGLETFFSGNRVWYTHWGWMLAAIIVCFWLGFDLRGSVEASPSEATGLLEKLGIHSIGKLYSSHGKTRGTLNHNTVRCTNCGACMGVCPKGVFDFIKIEKRVSRARTVACFACGACVFQCPERALELS